MGIPIGPIKRLTDAEIEKLCDFGNAVHKGPGIARQLAIVDEGVRLNAVASTYRPLPGREPLPSEMPSQ